MERRAFLGILMGSATTLTLFQLESLLAATGYHEDGAYNGPLLTSYSNTTCGACPGGCGIRVRKVDGIPVRIEGNPVHPNNRGGLCPVGVSALALLVHADRIKQPLLRKGPRGSGNYQPISWDEAEKLIADKLLELKQANSPEQLLFIDHRKSGPGVDLARQFTYDFGSPNFYNLNDPTADAAASICGGDGTRFGYDLENARTLFCFGYPVFESGSNPVYYSGLRNRLLNRQEGEKGKFIVIDPRLSASAANAERWIPIKPGAYGLLALGMLYFIIKERLYDEKRVKRSFVGFEDYTDTAGNRVEGFKSYVLKNYFPSRVTSGTGVPVDQIILLSRLFANTPKSIALAGTGAVRTVDGVYQSWAIMALNAIAGNFGSSGTVGSFRSLPFETHSKKKFKVKPIVDSAKSEFPYLDGMGSIESVPDSILQAAPYPIRVAIINNADPVNESLQSDKFKQALRSVPFSVVFAERRTETSVLADLVLPECTFLEKNDLTVPDTDFPQPVVSVTQPVIEPLHESRQVENTLVSLGKKLLGSEWQRWKDYRNYLEDKLHEIYNTGYGMLFSDQFTVSFESLLAERGWRRQEFKDFDDFKEQFNKTGGWWDTIGLPESGESRIPTASGKFYLVSDPLRREIADSNKKIKEMAGKVDLNIETPTENMLGAFRKSEVAESSQFPLSISSFELITFRGAGSRLSSMAEMVGHYENVKWESWVELNPDTAREYGLKDGQKVWVESMRGRKRVKLRTEVGLIPDVLAVPIGFGGSGTNTFGEDLKEIFTTKRDFLTGAPAIEETRVRVYA